jgi:excisionase family DNA binding protein
MLKQSVEPKSLFRSIPRVAVRWGVSRYTVLQSIRDGNLRAVCLGRRLMIPIEEIERVERGKVAR